MYDFDSQIDRHNTGSVKWERYGKRDIIPLWVADMDFRSPPEVIDALHKRIEHGVFGYTRISRELTETVISLLQVSYGWKISAQSLVWIPGLVCGLNIASNAVGEKNDSVITASPVYPPFFSAPENAGRRLIKVSLLKEGGRWTFDFDALERSITKDTVMLLLCNPHNPVGRVFDRAELLQLAELCEKHNLIICSDEIHNGLILDYSKKHLPIASLNSEIEKRTITLMAPSKTFNIPGLGCSFAIIPNEKLKNRFNRASAGIVPHVNALGLTAALAAYCESKDWHLALLKYLRKNRDLVYDAFSKIPDCSVSPVEATYLAWIDMRNTGIKDPVSFLEKAGVGLSDGTDFGTPGFVRLNFGCTSELLSNALDRIKEGLLNR